MTTCQVLEKLIVQVAQLNQSENRLVWFGWGDFDSLKQFVADSLKLKGVWSQPGGDKKVFATEDVSIIWRKNKNLLFIKGAKANQLKREVCRYICGHSSEMADTLAEITELKHGQLSNGEAIKMLSDKCEYMSTVISQMSKNIESFVEETSDRYVELINSYAGHANGGVVCDAKDDDGTKPINTEQLVSTVYNNGDYSLLTNDSHGSMGNDNTYAKVNTRRPPTKLIQHSSIPNKGVIIEESIMINDVEIANHNPVPQNLTQQDNVSSDGFIGVKRKRQSTKKFFLSGIANLFIAF